MRERQTRRTRSFRYFPIFGICGVIPFAGSLPDRRAEKTVEVQSLGRLRRVLAHRMESLLIEYTMFAAQVRPWIWLDLARPFGEDPGSGRKFRIRRALKNITMDSGVEEADTSEQIVCFGRDP
jgi:hypothetical protein